MKKQHNTYNKMTYTPITISHFTIILISQFAYYNNNNNTEEKNNVNKQITFDDEKKCLIWLDISQASL